MDGTLEALVQVVTLALDNGITPDTVAKATRHGSREELAHYLAINEEDTLSGRLLRWHREDEAEPP